MDELKIGTDGVGDYTKTIKAKIDMAEVNPNGGWEAITPVGSQTPSSYYKTFHITEKNDGTDGWAYSTAGYAVTFKYDCATGNMTCGVYERGNDVTFRTADFTNTYTKQAASTKTVEIPFTKVVKLGGNANAGSQSFELKITPAVECNVKTTAVVNTTGAGTYNGTITIEGAKSEVQNFVNRGFSVEEKNDGAANWTYDNAKYNVMAGNWNGTSEPVLTFTQQAAGGETVAATALTFTNTYTRNTSSTVYPTQPTKPTSSPKTFDAGIGVYAVSALLSVTGGAWLVGKKHK